MCINRSKKKEIPRLGLYQHLPDLFRMSLEVVHSQISIVLFGMSSSIHPLPDNYLSV